jgi:parallel beta-helix repeat protein
MSGNFCQGNNGSGLDIYSSTYATCSGNQSANNKFRGIECDTGSTYSVIDGNVVYGNFDVGISCYNTVGSVVSNNSVIGNGTLGTVTNPLSAAPNLPYGIALIGAGSYGNYSMVLGNQISQNIGSGANGVGLFIDAACVNVQLLGNSFANNTTNTTSVKANFAFVRDNLNVYTQQRGTAKLGAALTAVAVTFSPALTYAPDCAGINVQFTSMPTANTGPFSITAISAAGFTINTNCGY